MLVLYALAAIILVVAFVIWCALYIASKEDDQLELINEDKLKERHKKLKGATR